MIKSKTQLFLQKNEPARLKYVQDKDQAVTVCSGRDIEQRVFVHSMIIPAIEIDPSEYDEHIELAIKAAESIYGLDAELSVFTANWEDGKWGCVVGLYDTFYQN